MGLFASTRTSNSYGYCISKNLRATSKRVVTRSDAGIILPILALAMTLVRPRRWECLSPSLEPRARHLCRREEEEITQ